MEIKFAHFVRSSHRKSEPCTQIDCSFHQTNYTSFSQTEYAFSIDSGHANPILYIQWYTGSTNCLCAWGYQLDHALNQKQSVILRNISTDGDAAKKTSLLMCMENVI